MYNINRLKNLTGSPFSPGPPRSPFMVIGSRGAIGVVHVVKQLSVQHFSIPSQSESNKHVIEPSRGSGGHSAIGSGSGQAPGFSATKKKRILLILSWLGIKRFSKRLTSEL